MSLMYTSFTAITLLILLALAPLAIGQSPAECRASCMDADSELLAVAVRHVGIDVWDIGTQRLVYSIEDPAVDGNCVKLIESQHLIISSAQEGSHNYLQFFDIHARKELEQVPISSMYFARSLECTEDESLLLVGLSERAIGVLDDLPNVADASELQIRQCIVAVPLTPLPRKQTAPISKCHELGAPLRRWLQYCNLDQVYEISLSKKEMGVRIAIAGMRQGEARVQWGQSLKDADSPLSFFDERVPSACELCIADDGLTIVVGGSEFCHAAEVPAFTWDTDSSFRYGKGDVRFINHREKMQTSIERVTPAVSIRCGALCAGPSPSQCITGSLDGTVCVWDCRSGQRIRSRNLSNHPIHAVSLKGDIILVATLCELLFVPVDSF